MSYPKIINNITNLAGVAGLTYEGGPLEHHRQFDKPATRKKSNKGLCLPLGWAAHCSKMQNNVQKPHVMILLENGSLQALTLNDAGVKEAGVPKSAH